MTENELEKLILPSLRGEMGDWPYYSCLISMRELGKRVHYAREIYKNKNLSDMLQRNIEEERSEAIAKYIKNEKERFFNSIVIGAYGEAPLWHALNLDDSSLRDDEKHLLNEVNVSGFMKLSGQEKLFAIDGQHRLSGIRKLLEQEEETGKMSAELDDMVSIIFVSHKDSEAGRRRSRKLFTTLNKMAKLVNKKNIIALDETDVMAITTRYLIEDTDIFPNKRIDFSGGVNISRGNTTSLTTIINLYDILSILFSVSYFPQKKPLNDLKIYRPEQGELNEYFNCAENFFKCLGKHFPEIKEFLSSGNDASSVIKKYRSEHGGSILFRPRGLKEFTKIISILTKTMSLEDAIKLSAKVKTDITKPPYLNLIWNANDGSIISKNFSFLREILLDMLGGSSKDSNKGDMLLKEYRVRIDDENADLPKKVIAPEDL